MDMFTMENLVDTIVAHQKLIIQTDMKR